MSHFPYITCLTFLPLVGGFIVIGLGKSQERMARALALGFSLLAFVFALVLWRQFDQAPGSMQLEETHAWIPAQAVQYHVGVDGLSLLMLLLTAL
ncbi:MAG TPA: NADH-quinone oxidoreductase subunit M, partial [Verrucomicrobiae bacterium]|nr:NADH-quinone oxidoreductase subunit M [Verrucomicrobiae bacterium]